MTTSVLCLLLLFALAIVQLPHLVHSAAHGGGPHPGDRGCGVGAQRVPRSEVLKGVSCCFTEAPADQPRQLVITAHGGFSRKKEIVRRGAKLKRTWKEVAAPAVFKFYTTEGQYTYGNAVADLVLRAQANSHDPAHIDDALKALLPRTSDLVHEIRAPGQPPLSNGVFAATFSVVRRRVFDLFRARSDAVGGRSLIETVKRGDKMLDYDLSPLYHLSDEKRVDEAGRHNNEQAATVNFQRHGVVDVCFLDKDSSLKKVLKAATTLLTKHHPGASYAVMHAAFCRFQDGPLAHHADAAKYVKAEVPPMAAEVEVSAAALNAMRQIYHEMTLEQFQAAAQAAFVTLNLEPIAFNEE